MLQNVESLGKLLMIDHNLCSNLLFRSLGYRASKSMGFSPVIFPSTILLILITLTLSGVVNLWNCHNGASALNQENSYILVVFLQYKLRYNIEEIKGLNVFACG